jgi:hypothetical protein
MKIRSGMAFFKKTSQWFCPVLLNAHPWQESPFHHGTARPQVADGGDGLEVRRVAANILNKQSRTSEKGWSSSLGVWRGSNNSPSQTLNMLQNGIANCGLPHTHISMPLGPGPRVLLCESGASSLMHHIHLQAMKARFGRRDIASLFL